ncbi:uncharacterized protein LOC136093154 [Hydra vulgaris]|uniref:uncharacterized protein LOC136093154 n=1 Tax=Hydra vulgaris TaxID=6087 RepID=UPI0032EA7D51
MEYYRDYKNEECKNKECKTIYPDISKFKVDPTAPPISSKNDQLFPLGEIKEIQKEIKEERNKRAMLSLLSTIVTAPVAIALEGAALGAESKFKVELVEQTKQSIFKQGEEKGHKDAMEVLSSRFTKNGSFGDKNQKYQNIGMIKNMIYDNAVNEKLGYDDLQYDLGNLYKPIIDSQSGIKENLSKLENKADHLAITLLNYPAIIGIPETKEITNKDIIKPIWEEINRKSGKGVIFLPSDPDALIEMLTFRIAALKVGNNGARNEAVAICDELLRQGVLNEEEPINNALKISRNLANKAIASDLGKTAIDAEKVAGKELATNTISTAKDIIVEKGNKLIKKSKLKPESKQVSNLVESGANDLAQNLSNVTKNINRMMMGSAIPSKKLNHSNATKLEELMTGLFFLPSKAYIQVEGGLLKAADSASYANADVVTLTQNIIMHLFSRMEYDLSGQNKETVYNLGQATTMLGMLKYSNDFQ